MFDSIYSLDSMAIHLISDLLCVYEQSILEVCTILLKSNVDLSLAVSQDIFCL